MIYVLFGIEAPPSKIDSKFMIRKSILSFPSRLWNDCGRKPWRKLFPPISFRISLCSFDTYFDGSVRTPQHSIVETVRILQNGDQNCMPPFADWNREKTDPSQKERNHLRSNWSSNSVVWNPKEIVAISSGSKFSSSTLNPHEKRSGLGLAPWMPSSWLSSSKV